MTPEQLTDLRRKIAENIRRTETDIGRLEEATRPIGPDDSIGRVSRMDAINNKSVAEAGLRTARRKLDSLKKAARKIDEGTPGFGICQRCRLPIAPARLMFLPESTHCVRCAR